jgi:hypothetical protein
MLSIRAHGILDYFIAAVLILTPFLFGFSQVLLARDVFMVVGFALAGYSLLTDYVYSLTDAIPLSMHMTFDVVSGVFLILAPMIYGYRDELSGFQNALHSILGIGAVALVVFTRRGEEPTVMRALEDEEEFARPVDKAA